jgi:hypothetical protein
MDMSFCRKYCIICVTFLKSKTFRYSNFDILHAYTVINDINYVL